jgi:hypothetical protein
VYPPDTVFKPRVLIIDQFEELVTTNPTLWPQRAAFFKQLKEALARDKQLWVLLTLREDYVANFDPYLHLNSQSAAPSLLYGTAGPAGRR